jgi:hypothetical protein
MTDGARIGYCIRRRADPPPPSDLTGIDGHPVHAVEAGELAVWVSAEAAGPATVERVRQYDAVVRAAMRSATPLPLRYGTRFADEAEAIQLLLARAAELEGALERVAGRVEMGLRVVWKEPPPARPAADAAARPPHSGREYLERRRAEIQADEEIQTRAGALLDRLDRHFPGVPVVRTTGSERGVVGSLAHLVQVDSLAPYRALVQSARDDLVEAGLVLTGPWAPYSFV